MDILTCILLIVCLISIIGWLKNKFFFKVLAQYMIETKAMPEEDILKMCAERVLKNPLKK